MSKGNRTDVTHEVEQGFSDLKTRLTRFVEGASPTDENLHFARFEKVDRESLAELTRLAHEGRTRVQEWDAFFKENALYADGMFWYDLFLTISATSLSYMSVVGEVLPAADVETLVITLVLISQYTTMQQGDITKRNGEALGNLLLMAADPDLSKVVSEKAATLGTPVQQFVDETLRLVNARQRGHDSLSSVRRGTATLQPEQLSPVVPPPKTFRRRLRNDSMVDLLTKPALVAITEAVHEDPELDIQLRGHYVDVYYEGQSVFQINFETKLISIGSTHDEGTHLAPGWDGRAKQIDDFDPEQVRDLVAWVKDLRSAGLKPENQFEAKVIRDNRDEGSPVVVLDRQIVIPGAKGRMDVLLYDRESRRLVLAELKVSPNSEIQAHAFAQLQDYERLFMSNPVIGATYPHVFEQKVALRLMRHDVDAIDVAQPPLLLLLFSGYALEKQGHRKDTQYLHRALKAKTTEFRGLDVRVHSWKDFHTESCILPSPVSHLPTFEAWADDNLAPASGGGD